MIADTEPMQGQIGNTLLVIDAHVHIHQCFDLGRFFDSAYSNCEAQAAHHQARDRFQGVLLLTESSWDHWFAQLQLYAEQNQPVPNGPAGHWTFHLTGEPEALLAQSNMGRELFVIAGRQLVTKEKLEVLALMTDRQFQDGLPLSVAIDEIRQVNGIPVIPWGFGKWMGRRGKILSELIRASTNQEFALGDNGGRPNFLPYPSQFTQARQRGIPILPGSDPLPLPSEYWRPCSIGFSLRGAVRRMFPVSDLRSLLQNHQIEIMPFMRCESVFRFLKNQLTMRIVK